MEGSGTAVPSGTASFTGNFILQNNNATASGTDIVVYGSVDNTGTITNSGTGTGATLISGSIGSGTTTPGAQSVMQSGSASELILSNTDNFYSGATTITGGTLALVSASTMNNIASSTQIVVGTGTGTNATLNVNGIAGGFVVPVAQTLGGYGTVTSAAAVTVNGTLTPGTGTDGGTLTFSNGLTIGNGAHLNYGLGSTGDLVAVTGSLTLSGSAILNFSPSGTLVTGTAYDLITYTGSLTGGGNLPTWSLGTGTVPVGTTGETFGTLSLGGGTNAITVTFNATLSTPATAYWQGSLGASGTGSWSTITSGSTNFTSDATGTTNTGLLPGSATNVKFAANGGTNLNTTLGADFTINSLEFTGTSTSAATNPVTIGGTNTLTIMAGGTNGNTAGNGITVDAGSAAHTIGSKVALGASQAWIVNGGPLTVSGTVSDGGHAFGLTKSGTGTLILSASETYSGATVVGSGILEVDGSLSGSSAVTVDVATLSGTGNIGGNVALTGTSNIHSAGTLTVASLGVSGVGNTISSGTVDATGGTTLNNGSSLAVNGTLGGGTVTTGSGSILSGTGTVTSSLTVSAGGVTSPGAGNTPGVLKADMGYNSSSTANFNLSSANPANGSPKSYGNTSNLNGLYYSQIVVLGGSNTVNLGIGTGVTLQSQTAGQIQPGGTSNSGVTLQLTLSSADYATLAANATTNYQARGANSTLDNYFVFNLGSGLTAGRFETLALDVNGVTATGLIYYAGSGDRFVADGVGNTIGDVIVDVNGVNQEFALSYTGVYGTNSTTGGNDIVLTAIPEPGTLGMILGGSGMLIGFQRLRKRRMGI